MKQSLFSDSKKRLPRLPDGKPRNDRKKCVGIAPCNDNEIGDWEKP